MHRAPLGLKLVMQRRTFIAGACAAFAMPAYATPLPYRLGPNGATITYTFDLRGELFTGTVPINHANLTIDASNLEATMADVTADVRRARTGFIFATKALKSPRILAAKEFPLARFQSTKVILGAHGHSNGRAKLEGLLTMRGVTRPVRFDARVVSPSDLAQGPQNILNVALSGTVDRRDYGAVGYKGLIADAVKIDIKAQIETPA